MYQSRTRSPSRRSPLDDSSVARLRHHEDKLRDHDELIDRLLLGRSATEPAGAHPRVSSPGNGRSASAGNAGTESSPGALRLEVVLLQQRATALEDRVAAVEGSLSRAVSRVEDLSERLQNEARSFESVRVLAETAREAADMANRRAEATRDSLQRQLDGLEQRMRGELGMRVEEAVRAALASHKDEIHSSTRKAIDPVNARLGAVESSVQNAIAGARETVSRGLIAVKRHVTQELDRHTDTTQAHVDGLERDREHLRRVEAELRDEVSALERQLQSCAGSVGELSSDVKDLTHRVAGHDDELASTNRRLVSALRHLAADPAGTSMLHMVSPVPRPDVSANDASRVSATGPQSLLDTDASPRVRSKTETPERIARSPGRAVSFAESRSGRPGTSGATPSPIDQFLAELSGIARVQPNRTAVSTVGQDA